MGAVPPATGAPRWFTPEERLRHDRLALAADRAAYVAAHLLIREAAADLLGCEARDLVLRQDCAGCRGTDHGRPRIEGAGLHVSLSHTRAVVAAMAATTDCGIDVEQVGAEVPRRALTRDEAAWVEHQPVPAYAAVLLWTRKEALVKATGASLGEVLATDVRDGALEGGFGHWRGAGHVASWRLCPAP